MATASRKGVEQSTANVGKFLKGIDFPVQKQELVQAAKKNQAEREVLDLIQNMEEREYNSMSDVMKSCGSPQRSSGSKEPQRSQARSQSKHGQTHHR